MVDPGVLNPSYETQYQRGPGDNHFAICFFIASYLKFRPGPVLFTK